MGVIVLKESRELQTTRDRVWDVLANEFADISKWATAVVDSKVNVEAVPLVAGPPIAGRVCEVAGFGHTVERVIEYDEEAHVIAYSITATKVPGFVESITNRWTVEAAGAATAEASSQVTVKTSGVLGAIMGPILKNQLRRTLAHTMEDLAIYAETGQSSAAKQASRAQ